MITLLGQLIADGKHDEAREILRGYAIRGYTLEATAVQVGVSVPQLHVIVRKLGMIEALRAIRKVTTNPKRFRLPALPKWRGIVLGEETEVEKEKSAKFQALMTLQPEEAKEKIITAFRRARCLRAEAGKIIGVNGQTFSRWARKLGVRLDKLEEKAVREGWYHDRFTRSPGRPPKEKDG